MVDPVLGHGDRGGRDPGRHQELGHLVPVPPAGPFADVAIELVLIRQSSSELCEPLRPGPLLTDDGTAGSPLGIVPAGDRHPGIPAGRREDAMGSHGRLGAAVRIN